MDERRSTIRVPVGLEGTYQRLGDLSGPRLGITEDISLGGLRLSSASPLQAGDHVAIEMKLPQQGAVSLKGLVVWSRQIEESGQRNYESGLRWDEVDAHAQARLNAFVTGFTRSRSYFSASAGMMPASRVRWELSVGIALTLFAVAFLGFMQWAEHRRLAAEVESLNQTVAVYQQALRSFPQ